MKRRYSYLFLMVLILAAAIAVATFSGMFKPEVTTSGIYGTVTIGPVSPVSRAGDESKNVKPYQATIVVKDKNGTHEVKRFSSDKDGKFRVYLAPGTYRLEPLSPNSMPPIGKPETVTVTPNSFTEVNISYDSGIR